MKKILFVPLALALAAAPAIGAERANQPVEGEEVAGASGLLIGALAVAAIIAGVVVVSDDDDKDLPVSS